MTTARTSNFTYSPIATWLARRIRSTMIDDFGNRLNVRVSAEDGSPCRHCLRRMPAGTRLILFAYRPFEGSGPYAEIGPIFVCAGECERYAGAHQFPRDFTVQQLTLRAYDTQGDIVTGVVSPPGEHERTLEDLFALERTQYVHARSSGWGCYYFRIDRE